jgi:hypothetical protein
MAGPACRNPGLLAVPGHARGHLVGPALIGLKQPLRQIHKGRQVREATNRVPRIDPAQEQHFGLVQIADPCRDRVRP